MAAAPDPVLSRARALAGKAIDVEAGADAADGYTLARQAGRWQVRAANPRSALWAVRRLLEAGPPPAEGRHQPRFSVRGLNPCESLARHSDAQLTALLDRMERWRLNTLVIHTEYGYKARRALIDRLCEERGLDRLFYIQTSLAFLPGAPVELFARDQDGKPHTPALCNGTRLCVSRPDALAWFESHMREFLCGLTLRPGDRLLLMDADGLQFCQCHDCRSIHPVDQWMRLFAIAVRLADEAGLGNRLEYLSYVNRFRPPQDRRVFDRISGVMFDTHLRFRWMPLRADHQPPDFQAAMAEVDPQLRTECMNRYLRNMLALWRTPRRGRLYIFENLMMQFTLSTHQPCTGNLLDDLDLYADMGIDGIIYEAFEPGIPSFAGQLETLAKAAWGDTVEYVPSRLEQACAGFADEVSQADIFGRNMSPLKYLETDRFDGIALLKEAVADSTLVEYETRLREFIRDRSVRQWKNTVSFVLEHPDRFDWMYIAFQLARQVPRGQWAGVTDRRARQFLEAYKLWDLMEQESLGPDAILAICQTLMGA